MHIETNKIKIDKPFIEVNFKPATNGPHLTSAAAKRRTTTTTASETASTSLN